MIQLDYRLEEAVQVLWVRMDYERGGEAKRILEQLAQEGNADAYFFLARCYAGSCFVDQGFGFPEDDNLCFDCLNQSIEGGSALGMFAGRRFGGFEPRCGSFIQPPYHSDREIWEEVCALASAGEAFTQYLVANAFYFGDVYKFLETDFSNMTRAQIEDTFRQWKIHAAKLYEEQFARGIFNGAVNYRNIFTEGEFGLAVDKKRAMKGYQMALDAGRPQPGWKKTLFGGWKRV